MQRPSSRVDGSRAATEGVAAGSRPLLSVLLLCALLPGQAGDRPDEAQPEPPQRWLDMEAPVLTPEEALDAFRVAPGFRVELVAAEPLTEDPMALAFDAGGRLWVCEMRSFMPDVDGSGEQARTGVIAVLEDTDGDGRMDTRHVFADDLVLPRALALHEDGVLFIAPPYLRLFRDRDGDGLWDDQDIVSYGLGGLRNVEHAPNGLLRNLDNWIYLANHAGRYRLVGRRWRCQPTGGGGQWGITRDDTGRLLYNTNSDQLRGDVVPTHLAVRNTHLGTAFGVNVRVARDQTVWPAHPTPGVNRGYKEGLLREDGTLSRFTAACGPVVYRGDAYPEAFHGDAFVAEPAGNLVKRNRLRWDPEEGMLRAEPAYQGREFLASTDERFRPVNLFCGPDGCLYVVDMYRGIIQHRMYVTTWLRKQILARGLDEPVGLGRIWRIVPEGFERPEAPRLSSATTEELVAALSSPGGWWRDTAQRLLVERCDRSAVPALRELARAGRPIPALHALWTLEGLGGLEQGSVLAAVDSPDPRLRVHGLRLAGILLRKAPARVLRARLLTLTSPSGTAVRRQLLFTLGGLGGEDAEAAMARLLTGNARRRGEREAAVSGLAGRELAFTERLLDARAYREAAPGRAALLELLAACVVREGAAPRIRRLFERARDACSGWQCRALLAGVAGTRKAPQPEGRPLRLDRAPEALADLERAGDAEVAALARRIAAFTTWPGAGDWEELRLRPLTPKERDLFERGRRVYGLVCAGCHQPDGAGMGGLAPPLAASRWVTGPSERLVRILVDGLAGPVEVAGRTWDLEMPGLPGLTDAQIAAVLTYVRRGFGNEAAPVPVPYVAAERRKTADRGRPWTARELRQIR